MAKRRFTREFKVSAVPLAYEKGDSGGAAGKSPGGHPGWAIPPGTMAG